MWIRVLIFWQLSFAIVHYSLSVNLTKECKDRYLKFGEDHTMCKYASQNCTIAILDKSKKMTGQDQILSYHNELRQKVALGKVAGQPAASNMKELKWNDELALVAQRWADQCNFGHDDNNIIEEYKDRSKQVGQNVGYYGSTIANPKVNFTKLIDPWFDEYKLVDKNVIKYYIHDKNYGHYTQIVWANTESVGCGYTYFLKGIFHDHYLVCNYGPAGNFLTQPVYKIGKAATKCNGSKSKYEGLCA